MPRLDANFRSAIRYAERSSINSVSDFNPGLLFLEVNLFVDAAIQGQGASLAGSISVNDTTEKGQLIKPFDLTISQDFTYCFVTHPTKAGEPKAQAFRHWIPEQIEAATNS